MTDDIASPFGADRERYIAEWFLGYINSWLCLRVDEKCEANRRSRLGWKPGMPIPTPTASDADDWRRGEPALYDAWASTMSWPPRRF